MEQQPPSPPPAATADGGGNGSETTAFATGSQSKSQQELASDLRRSSTGNLSSYSSFSGTQGGVGPGLRRTRTRQFSRSSTDLPPMPTINENSSTGKHEEHSHWHAFSLVFVALPAISGLFFENGSAVMTDILLLSLGCLFLYWSVNWPFQWYHSAQAKLILAMDDFEADDDFAVVEESIQGEETEDAQRPEIAEEVPHKTPQRPTKQERKQHEAVEGLRSLELMALASCFISPMAVAYLLHAIRPYLSRPSGGLVSNSNLTLFVLAAEVRPLMHVLKLVEARTLYLQRVVTEFPSAAAPSTGISEHVEDLIRRISALETSTTSRDQPTTSMIPEEDVQELSSKSPSEQVDAVALAASLKSSIQPQLDALNRAVRRYERRATTQSVVLEARLHGLDSRVNDALSLAAAASRIAQQRPSGPFTWIFQAINYLVASIVFAVFNLVLAPWTLIATSYTYLKGLIFPSTPGKTAGKKKFDSGNNTSVSAKSRNLEKSPLSPIGSGGYVIVRGKAAVKA